jgi:U3 small nucleolar RNA-associated protein 10
MKTMNLKIMVLLKNKNTKIHKAVFELTDKLIDELKDRFLLLVNDLIPFLLESAGSRHEGVSKLVRKIIAKIEELSGEEIQNYVK